MKRWYLVIVVVLVGIAGIALLARPGRSMWTTDSPEALRELEAGLAAQQKVYYDEARVHFERAVELDPDLTVAKILLVQRMGRQDAERRKELLEELHNARLDTLTPREQFLVSYVLAGIDGDEAAAQQTLEAYLEKVPDDPHALNYRAYRAFHDGRWDEASRDYRRITEVAPNFVVAYNQLGYLQMSLGNFEESEAMFRKYRFIAPEQANPRDSLGELLTVTGRYAEAEQEFEEALRVKPDFCASLGHLVTLYLFSGQFERVDAAIDRAGEDPGCGELDVDHMRRDAALWRAAHSQDWTAVLNGARDEKGGYGSGYFVLLHTALSRLGRIDEARDIELDLGGRVSKLRESGADASRVAPLDAAVRHMAGVRLLVSGKQAEAADEFRSADNILVWRNMDEGIFKLYNLALLAKAARASGERGEAASVNAKIGGVNPIFLADVERGDSIIGPETRG